MKTSPAIMLAVAAPISGATVSLNPGAGFGATLAQIWCTRCWRIARGMSAYGTFRTFHAH